MSTKRPTRAKQPTRAERLARWLNMGTCGMQDQRDAAAELLRLHALVTTYEADKIQCTPAAPMAVPELWVFNFDNGATAWTRDGNEAQRIKRYLKEDETVTEYVRTKGGQE